MRQYLPELMPLIVEALLDGASANKREVAVATLGQVVQSTGYVACSAVFQFKGFDHYLRSCCFDSFMFFLMFCYFFIYPLTK